MKWLSNLLLPKSSTERTTENVPVYIIITHNTATLIDNMNANAIFVVPCSPALSLLTT